MEELETLEARWRLSRVTWSLVWLAMLAIGLNLWGSWTIISWSSIASISIILVSLAGLAMLWSHHGYPTRLFEWLTMLAATVSAGVGAGVQIMSTHYYGNDAAAFSQIATKAFLAGRNPYTVSMSKAQYLLNNVTHYWTYTLNGGHVVSFSYPAGSVLLQAPLTAMGVPLAGEWLDLIAWLATGVILFLILPRSLRFIAGALLLNAVFITRLGSNGTDAVFLPFLVLAAWRWDKFTDLSVSRWLRYLGPVSLGVACSIKQSPWFCLPFFVAGIAIEAYEDGHIIPLALLRYTSVVAGVFVLINIHFILLDPSAWLHGTLLPIMSPLVPDGQGLVSLALHGVVRGARIHILWLAALAGWASLIIGYALWYKRLKASWMFFIPLILFIPGRSLSSYLLDFFPAAIAAAITVTAAQRLHFTRVAQAWRIAVVSVPVAATVILSVLAFRSPVLDVALTKWTANPPATILKSVQVSLRNNTTSPLTTYVEVLSGDNVETGFWVKANGRSGIYLAPGQTVTKTLYPTVLAPAPLPGQSIILEAMTSRPPAVSTSKPTHWVGVPTTTTTFRPFTTTSTTPPSTTTSAPR